jgi:purine/pyrimidine-nucleoside phosphorylase
MSDQLSGSNTWANYGGGQSFSVPGNPAFNVEVPQTLHYLCHVA